MTKKKASKNFGVTMEEVKGSWSSALQILDEIDARGGCFIVFMDLVDATILYGTLTDYLIGKRRLQDLDSMLAICALRIDAAARDKCDRSLEPELRKLILTGLAQCTPDVPPDAAAVSTVPAAIGGRGCRKLRRAA